MAVGVVIGRELRAEARRIQTYVLRVALAGTALAIFGATVWASDLRPRGLDELGLRLFGNLQSALFLVIWFVVPFLVSDTLSREKREGTLGLLFLTPLRHGSVVTGKLLSHGFRALSLLAVFVPVLAVPGLVGGVSWREYVGVLLIDIASLALALSAALLASSWATRWNRALLLGLLLTVVVLLLFGAVYFAAFAQVIIGPSQGTQAVFWRSPSWRESLSLGLGLLSGVGETWGQCRRFMAGQDWLALNGAFAVAGLLVAVVVPRWVAGRLGKSLQTAGSSLRRQAWEHFWVRPRVAPSWLKARMRRALDRNPIGWLQQRQTSARVTKWGWCLAAVLAQVLVVIAGEWRLFLWGQFWLALFLVGGLSISAAGSFRAERESGALELLLVTPLRERDIVWGRMRGLWWQFAAGLSVVLAMSLWWSMTNGGPSSYGGWRRYPGVSDEFYRLLPLVPVAGWLATPAVGLAASLERKTFAEACLVTLGWGVVLPAVLVGIVPGVLSYAPFRRAVSMVLGADQLNLQLLWGVMVVQIGLAVAAAHRLQQRLARRDLPVWLA